MYHGDRSITSSCPRSHDSATQNAHRRTESACRHAKASVQGASRRFSFLLIDITSATLAVGPERMASTSLGAESGQQDGGYAASGVSLNARGDACGVKPLVMCPPSNPEESFVVNVQDIACGLCTPFIEIDTEPGRLATFRARWRVTSNGGYVYMMRAFLMQPGASHVRPYR